MKSEVYLCKDFQRRGYLDPRKDQQQVSFLEADWEQTTVILCMSRLIMRCNKGCISLNNKSTKDAIKMANLWQHRDMEKLVVDGKRIWCRGI